MNDALVDLSANVLNEGLDDRVTQALEAVNARLDPPITASETARVHAEDRRLRPLVFRLEHVKRRWQQRVRRRPYEFLLPEKTTYEEHATT
jgi:hypothetical protein